jgi:hypothetical protein
MLTIVNDGEREFRKKKAPKTESTYFIIKAQIAKSVHNKELN